MPQAFGVARGHKTSPLLYQEELDEPFQAMDWYSLQASE